jgi:EAL domain-containing protein (putative c-di-GMP-specific phosphodiesterase class I)
VSLFPDDAQDREALIQHANSAVIEAEAHGEPFMLYNHDLHEAAIARLTLQTELQRAFEAEQFELYYQPIVDEHGIVLGAEGLIRWHHPERGLLKPSDFIELAEQTGTIAAIDKWALYSVSKQMADWVERYDLFCSLNISALEFSDAYLSHVVSGALSNAGGLDPSRLKLELTESRCMDDPDRAVEQIKALREQGIEVWIDDFGTGQSSLSYLKRLPAPVLKIDKVFVEELPDSGEEREYLSHIIGSVHARGKEIVVEGVATRDQMDTLSAMGCRTMQGYFFSEPLPADRFAALLEQGLQLPS